VHNQWADAVRDTINYEQSPVQQQQSAFRTYGHVYSVEHPSYSDAGGAHRKPTLVDIRIHSEGARVVVQLLFAVQGCQIHGRAIISDTSWRRGLRPESG